MRLTLKPHPEFPPGAVDAIDVEVVRTDALNLRYVVTGAIGQILLPSARPSTRADELWKHTCFEAFVRSESGEVYHEFNFSPSTQWAAYRFTGYRSGMAPADIAAPRIETDTGAERFLLLAQLALPVADARRIGLSAIIEEASGAKSYWALAHPPGKPDFHHADGFALDLR